MVEMIDDMLGYERGVFADPREQGRSARPLPASTDEVQVRDGRNSAVVQDIALRVLGLGDRHPVGVVPVTGCPEHRIHLCRLTIGERDPLSFGLCHTTRYGHASSLQLLKFQSLAWERINLHQVASDRAFARGPQDAQLVHPPEVTPSKYPV